jgi:uncharacterized membrane protein SirB2
MIVIEPDYKTTLISTSAIVLLEVVEQLPLKDSVTFIIQTLIGLLTAYYIILKIRIKHKEHKQNKS